MIAAQLLFYFALSLGLLSYLGYGPARLLLPEQHRRWRLLLVPLLGLCATVVLSSFLNYLLPMTQVTWLILAAATVLNAALIWRSRSLGLDRPTRTDGVVLALMAVAYLLGVLPLIHDGTTAFLGLQWDLELYLPLTEYLKRYPMGLPLTAFPNPLLDAINSAPVRGGSGWGFSYLDAFLGTVVGHASFETFRPTLHLVFALSVPAVYLFCRGGLAMGAGAALLAAALTATNGLNLWIASMGLAGHAVTFSALPLAFTATLWALRDGTRRSVLLAGLCAATLLLSFYTGAVVLYALGVGGAGLAMLVRSTQRRATIVTGLGIAAATLAFGAAGHLRFLELLPLYFQHGFSGGWQVNQFSPLSQGLGLTPYELVVQRLGSSTAWDWLSPNIINLVAIMLTLGAAAFTAAALRRGNWDRTAFIALLLVFAAFGLYLRYVSPYPYGYFKLVSLGAFLLAAGLAQGIATLWAWSSAQHVPRPGPGAGLGSAAADKASLLLPRLAQTRLATAARGGMLLYGLLFLALLSHNSLLSVRFFWQPDPDELPRATWELHALQSIVPAGAPVLLSSRSSFEPRFAGMVAYFLIDSPITGDAKTAYGQAESDRPDMDYEYLVLQASERADVRGLSPEDLVWQNDLVALYQRPEQWLEDIDLESVRRPFFLSSRQPATLSLSPGGWHIASGGTRFEDAPLAADGPLQVEYTFLSFADVTARVKSPQSTIDVKLPAGLSTYRTQALALPTLLELSLADTSTPAWLLNVRLQAPESATAALTHFPDTLALRPTVRSGDGQAQLSLDYSFGDSRGGSVSLAAELYQQSGQNRALRPSGFWRLEELKAAGFGSSSFLLNTADWQCGVTPADLFPATETALEDGAYQVHLAAYYVNEEVGRWPWLSFTVQQGKIIDTQSVDLPPYQLLYLSPPRDVRSMEEALPAGAQVYLPPLIAPNTSFQRVAVASLQDRRFYTDAPAFFPGALPASPSQVYGYGLLPAEAVPADWGFLPKALWSNDQAALYPRDPNSTQPSARLGASNATSEQFSESTLLVDAEATLSATGAHVALATRGSVPPGAVLGVDIYGESACNVQHFGYWATPLNAPSSELRIDLDLPQQQGSISSASRGALPALSEVWPVHPGSFRAFLFYKDGDRYETSPLFEFTLTPEGITRTLTYPQTMRIPLKSDRGHTSYAR